MAHYTLSATTVQPNPFERTFSSVHPLVTMDALPPTVDLSTDLGPVRNQNIPAFGECSAESGAGAVDWLMRKWRKEQFFGSSLFLYECERLEVHQLYQDTGAMLRQTQYALQTIGTCSNTLDPDVHKDFVIPITNPMVADAATHRIADGLHCPTLLEILNALAHPTTPTVVQVGIVVYPGFESPTTIQTGTVPMPKGTDQALGGHAVLAWGYSMADRVVHLRNSWGTDYGIDGNFTLPFAYFATSRTFLSARAYYVTPQRPASVGSGTTAQVVQHAQCSIPATANEMSGYGSVAVPLT